MADDEKPPCRLLHKKSKETYYYKCEKLSCQNECLIYVLWNYIEEKRLDGSVVVTGYDVFEVGCECVKFDGWGGRPETPASCEADAAHVGSVLKNGKKYEKSFVRCISQGCPDECVFYIEYSDPTKEYGKVKDWKMGCACVKWNAL
jgi:hypothetical protein